MINHDQKWDIIENIWNLAKRRYRRFAPDIRICRCWPHDTSMSTFWFLVSISGKILNFDIEGPNFDIEVSIIRYRRTPISKKLWYQRFYFDIGVHRYRRFLDIDVQKHIRIWTFCASERDCRLKFGTGNCNEGTDYSELMLGGCSVPWGQHRASGGSRGSAPAQASWRLRWRRGFAAQVQPRSPWFHTGKCASNHLQNSTCSVSRI